jgi:cytochrome c oxidase subunit 2
MQIYPNDAKEIMVEASQYQFKFQYRYKDRMFGVVDSLVVPQGKPIRLIMSGTKNAFIHSFYVPNFRIKQDVMPNRYSQVWFQSDDIGTYDYYCTEYCGSGHSSMNGYVVVMSQDDYDDWYDKQVEKAEASMNLTGAAKGEYLYKDLGCAGCHSIKKDVINIGPSFKGKWGWGETITHTDGSVSVVDENYITRSIRYPGEVIVSGFTNQMNPDYVSLPQEDINAIIEFIKSLKE